MDRPRARLQQKAQLGERRREGNLKSRGFQGEIYLMAEWLRWGPESTGGAWSPLDKGEVLVIVTCKAV